MVYSIQWTLTTHWWMWKMMVTRLFHALWKVQHWWSWAATPDTDQSFHYKIPTNGSREWNTITSITCCSSPTAKAQLLFCLTNSFVFKFLENSAVFQAYILPLYSFPWIICLMFWKKKVFVVIYPSCHFSISLSCNFILSLSHIELVNKLS